MKLSVLIEALSAENVEEIHIKDMSQNMCQKIEDSAKGFGADMLITACPLCMYNLKKNGTGDLPVYYFTELLAEALGVKEEVAK